jgi:hypothetical protein
LHQWIERNDERERAKQHSNGNRIEHDKFVDRLGVLIRLRERCWQYAPDRPDGVSTTQTPLNIYYQEST